MKVSTLSFTKTLTLISIVIFIFGVALHFYNIQNLGIYGADVFFYWQTGFEWMKGNEDLTQHFRPFIYWLYSKAFLFGGANDSTLKIFNALLDSLSALLLVFLGYQQRKNILLALSMGIGYLFLLEPMLVARSELVHTPSTIFILLSTMSMLQWFKQPLPFFVFLSGAFLSFAWHIHPDLAVLGAAATVAIIWKRINSKEINAEQFWKTVILDFLAFLAGYFLVFAIFSMQFGVLELLGNLLENQKVQGKGLQNSFLWRFVTYSFHYLYENLGLVPLLALISGLVILINKAVYRVITTSDVLLLVYPVCYLFFCALLFSRYMLPRLFLPLVPLVIAFIFIQIHDFFKSKRLSPNWVVAIAMLFFASNFNTIKTVLYQEESVYRKVARDLDPYLGEDSKYLITPLAIEHIHSPLSNEVYLHGNGIYLVSTTEPSFEEVLKNRGITHVWIADVLYDPRLFGEFFKFSYEERLFTLWEKRREEYDVEQEKSQIRVRLKGKASLIHKSELGELYELK